MSQEVGVSGCKFGLGGGTFGVALSEAFEEGSDVGDVGNRFGVGVEYDDVVEVRGNAFQGS